MSQRRGNFLIHGIMFRVKQIKLIIQILSVASVTYIGFFVKMDLASGESWVKNVGHF